MTAEDRIAQLEQENAELQAKLAEAYQQIAQLAERLHQVEGQLAKDSHNSSKPPSSDSPAHKPRSRRFPESSKQISSNYYGDRKQKTYTRFQQRCEEMRQTVLSLHSQGLYPSFARVSSVLPSPGSARIPEVVATWRNTLSSLNIRKSRN
jgi:uncharacterized coiled-coil protein SlyX